MRACAGETPVARQKYSQTMSGEILVTGATGGIGREIAKALASMGESLILGSRNVDKAERLIAELSGRHEVVYLDLTDEGSVRDAASALADKNLKGVINNAGTMERHFRTDAQGREITMVVNYLNTRLLTELLLPRLKEGSRIVFTSSLTRFAAPWHDRTEISEKEFNQIFTYALSKKLLTRYASELSKRLSPRGIGVNCMDPGIVNTGMIHMDRWFDSLADVLLRPFLRSPKKGAEPALRAYTSAETGLIYCRRCTHRL